MVYGGCGHMWQGQQYRQGTGGAIIANNVGAHLLTSHCERHCEACVAASSLLARRQSHLVRQCARLHCVAVV